MVYNIRSINLVLVPLHLIFVGPWNLILIKPMFFFSNKKKRVVG